ncbi:MAG: bifunctional riboflavin kinase/FAD synthetase [Crocinitomicaceae bacterium]|nr:bifunctional riboflavin kinase/FAD synthetase [Crocinitomicaceae bacterium]MDP4866362.1 bifunctional riboflavin kinase/FAD synthetase [Crocinitomicaceae bacterium]MDP5010423.1 bifunctional riboflavin kinase/FAD synthetase [Crocinitomicaceae bacterium]
MKVFSGFDSILEIKNPVLTIGTFDGVHIGHQKIIERLNEEATKIDGESVLFTFYPHPRMVLFPDSHGLKLIQTQAEKIDKLRKCGLQNVIVFPFTKEFSRLTAIEFVRDYLVNRLNVKKLVIGYDHQFGKNREGSLEFLKEIADTYEYEVIEIPAQDIDEVNVSSTKIRNALLAGDIETANNFLGEHFELSGTVVKGNQIGSQMGFPTANIQIDSELKLIPGNGVYAVSVRLEDGSLLNGMLNIGTRPTVSASDELRIEVHLFDTTLNLYGQKLTVRFLKRVRDEKRFEDKESLINQLKNDEITVRNIFLAVHND